MISSYVQKNKYCFRFSSCRMLMKWELHSEAANTLPLVTSISSGVLFEGECESLFSAGAKSTSTSVYTNEWQHLSKQSDNTSTIVTSIIDTERPGSTLNTSNCTSPGNRNTSPAVNAGYRGNYRVQYTVFIITIVFFKTKITINIPAIQA